MSLEALNSPPLVALAGLSGALSMPFLQRLAAEGAISLASLKVANAASFAVQLVAVSIPGRIDEQVAKEMAKERRMETSTNNEVEEEGSDGKAWTPRDGRTLVSPASWAFAIWGPIFLGEIAFVASQFSVEESSPRGAILRKASVPFAMAQIFQTLWCSSFRPKYRGNLMYISTGLISAVAYSLSRAHAAFASSAAKTGGDSSHGLFFLPLAMHFGWTTAASLVNLNGALSMKESTSERTIALAGHASAVLASALGVGVTLARSAPTFGMVIAWALAACADGMRSRLKKADGAKRTDDGHGAEGMYSARMQLRLCRLGALASGAAAMFVGGRAVLGGRTRQAP